MHKIFHFDSPRENYHCDASVIVCFDNRFEAANRKFLKRIGVERLDPIQIAGGAKSLSSPEQEFHRAFVLDQIHKSIRLHGTERVILILHSDCGAYGGLDGRFHGDPAAEMAHYRQELASATEFLKNQIPSLRVESYILNFEGVWSVDQAEPASNLLVTSSEK